MSNEKNSNPEQYATRLRPAQDPARNATKPRQDVEVIALEIDEDFDIGGDPYNRTGSHCVIKIREE